MIFYQSGLTNFHTKRAAQIPNRPLPHLTRSVFWSRYFTSLFWIQCAFVCGSLGVSCQLPAAATAVRQFARVSVSAKWRCDVLRRDHWTQTCDLSGLCGGSRHSQTNSSAKPELLRSAVDCFLLLCGHWLDSWKQSSNSSKITDGSFQSKHTC